LKVLERIQFKLATIVYRSLNSTAPRYLAADLRRTSDMPSRRRLRSSLTDQLDVRQSQCSTVGDRAFALVYLLHIPYAGYPPFRSKSSSNLMAAILDFLEP